MEIFVQHLKMQCDYCPPPHHPKHGSNEGDRDWETHPSWIAGMEALNAYGDWVSSLVLPIAFQWVDEHRSEVYAGIPEDLKDDVGVVIAAAFKLVKELPAYKRGQEKCEEHRTTEHTSKINPVWTGIVKKVRSATEHAFEEQSSLLGDPPQS